MKKGTGWKELDRRDPKSVATHPYYLSCVEEPARYK